MRLNWIDRAIAHVAPVAAAQRARARVQLAAFGSMTDLQASSGGYTSTSGTDSFMRRWSTRPRDAASDILRQLPDQRGQSRDLARNNPIAASALNTNVVRAIMADTTLTSADYMAVQMLQTGQIARNWMGFTWIPYQSLDAGAGGSTEARTVAYAKSAVHFGTGIDTKTEVGENKQKRGHPTEAYAWMSIGAGRQDEKKVMAIDFVKA